MSIISVDCDDTFVSEVCSAFFVFIADDGRDGFGFLNDAFRKVKRSALFGNDHGDIRTDFVSFDKKLIDLDGQCVSLERENGAFDIIALVDLSFDRIIDCGNENLFSAGVEIADCKFLLSITVEGVITFQRGGGLVVFCAMENSFLEFLCVYEVIQ